MRLCSPLPLAALLFCAALLLPAPSPAGGFLCGALAAASLAAGARCAIRVRRAEPVRLPVTESLVLLLTPLGFLPLGSFVASAAGAAAPGRPLEEFLAGRGGSIDDPAELSGRLASEPERLREPRGGCLLEIDLDALRVSRSVRPLGGRVRVRVPPPPAGVRDACTLVPGTSVLVASTLAFSRPFGNPGASDPRWRLAAGGIVGTGRSPSARLLSVTRDPGGVQAALSAIRRGFLRTQVTAFGLAGEPEAAGSARAVVLGFREDLPEDLVRPLRLAGTAHLLAISGFHVAILALGARGCARRLGAGRTATACLVLATLALYAALTERQPSVLRAAATAALLQIAALAGRRPAPLALLAAVFLLSAAPRPWTVGDLSLQLSFLAVAALAGYAPACAAAIPGPRWLAWSLAANATALAATAPLIALLFNRATPGALFANLAAAPLIAIAFVASLFAPLGQAITPALAFVRVDIDPDLAPGTLLAAAASAAFRAAARSSAAIGAHSWASYAVCTPPGALPLVLVGIMALSRWEGMPSGIRRSLIAAGAVTLAWAVLPGDRRAPPAPGDLALTVLDVGQGSSALVETPGGKRILVDAGGFAGSSFDVGERVVARALLTMGIRRLDAIVVSHADVDHAGGIPAILDLFPGSELWLAAGARRSERVRSIVVRALERGRVLRLLTPERGFRYGGITVEPLHPPGGWDPPGSNDRSLVLRLALGEASALLPGDAGRASEARLAPSLKTSRVLLVPHHGSRTSSTPRFISSASPAWAVISCGRRNRYGHPAPEVTRRLVEAGARILRTDVLGAIRLELPAAGGAERARLWERGRWKTAISLPGRALRKAGERDPARSRPRGGSPRGPRRASSGDPGGSPPRAAAGGGG